MLKLDPKNTELLSQKQKVLNESIQTTEEKLKQLKEIKTKADEAMANGTEINEQNYRNLQREIINTQTKLSNLKNEASNWTKAGDKLIQWGENLDKVSQKIDSLGSKLTTRLTLPITAAATAGLTYDAQIEKYETAFKTFLGSAEKAGEAIKNIKDDAKRTPFDTTSLVKANQMLISTGVSAEDARSDILALGEAVIATGGGNDELVRMSSNLQQIKNAGKATAMDIRQFAYAGIDVYGILADYTGKTTKEVKDMEITYEDLTNALKKASSKGGKYFGAMTNSSETLTGQVSALKSEVQDMTGELVKSLMPTAKKVVAKARELIKAFDGLSDSEKENIVKIGLLVAAAGPALKMASSAIGIIGSVSKGIGTFSKAIALAHNGIGDATGSAATLAKVLQGLTSPAGIATLAIGGITAGIIAMTAKEREAAKQTKEKFEGMKQAALDYVNGIDSAKSHLSEFNREIFFPQEEQEKLKQEMEDVQKGISQIAQTASKERRVYTDKEIQQLDNYFKKLRELNKKELELEKSISEALIQQAKTKAESFKGTEEEYITQSQEWTKTLQEQSNKEIEIINSYTTQELALLNMRYSTESQRQSEEYQKKYNNLISYQEKETQKIQQQVATVSELFSNGYTNRLQQEESFLSKVKEANAKQEEENKRYNDSINGVETESVKTRLQTIIDENTQKRSLLNKGMDEQKSVLAQGNKNVLQELISHKNKQKEIWDNMYKNMSDSEAKQMGVWLAYQAQVEIEGGKLSKENQKLVDTIIENYDKLPADTKNIMKDTMQGMMKGMEEKEPSLFKKATGIADGILSRLRKTFDINSPSKETRDIFRYVMKGAELGLEDERKKLNAEADKISKEVLKGFNLADFGFNNGLKNNIIDSTKTVFTTPQINFYPQQMTEENMKACFNYINRKFGSAY